MLCTDPYVRQGVMFGCGKCTPCLVNRGRIWTHRIELECTQHEHNTFLTLTYDDEHLPSDGSLYPEHLRDFFKRLRHRGRFRYFAVGEYGDKTQRPHYHAALFGFAGCEWKQTRLRKEMTCCPRCSDVKKIWGFGNVYLGQITTASARYLCGYVTKKWTRPDVPQLQGRSPEFARMSRMPGIGASAMDDAASDLMQHAAADNMDVTGDPRPFGRYLTKRLRERRGLPPGAPQSQLDKIQEELRDLQLRARSSEEAPSIKEHFLSSKRQAVRNFEGRLKLYGKGKRL